MKFLNLISLFFVVSCTDLPLPSESPIQRIQAYAKSTLLDVRRYLDILQEKCIKAKDHLMEKVKNIAKRGEPIYEEAEKEDMDDDKIKAMIEQLLAGMDLKDLNFGSEDQENKEGEEAKDEKEEKEEKAL